MKKSLAIVIVFLIIALGGCAGEGMFGKIMHSDEAIADKQMEEFLNALENHDTDGMASLFAPNALSEVDEFQKVIDELYLYYQGSYNAYNNWNATNTVTLRENGRIIKEIYGTYDVTTDEGVYRFAFRYVESDSRAAENIGLWSVYVISMDLDIDPEYAYRGDGLYSVGIQIGIPNSIPG